MREKSYGQDIKLSLLDKIGCYFSVRRIKKCIKDKLEPGNRTIILDLGSGYDGIIARKLIKQAYHIICVDIELSEELNKIKNIQAINRKIENVLPLEYNEMYDVVLLISVIEHLEDPLPILKECRRVLKKDGVLLINVPTWRGKVFMEFNAFKLKSINTREIDDHKMYYDKKDLWPLLIKAGFKSSEIKLEYYKLGLNTFGVCRN